MDFKQRFSKRLRELRCNKRLTQAELAKELGVDQSTISYWENAKVAPNIEEVEKMMQYFMLSYEMLTDYYSPLSKPLSPIDNSSEQSEIISVQSLSDFQDKYGLTSRQLSRILGVSPSTITEWSKGGIPNFIPVFTLFEFSDFNIDEIMRLAEWQKKHNK